MIQKVLEIVAYSKDMQSTNGVSTNNVAIHTQILNFQNSNELELFKSKLITTEYNGTITFERRLY